MPTLELLGVLIRRTDYCKPVVSQRQTVTKFAAMNDTRQQHGGMRSPIVTMFEPELHPIAMSGSYGGVGSKSGLG